MPEYLGWCRRRAGFRRQTGERPGTRESGLSDDANTNARGHAMANQLFRMERCSDFQSPRKGAADRRTFAFIDVTVAEVHAAGLESSECVYDRGLNAGDDWILRVALDEIADAPRCECCDIASVTLDACDMCELCARAAAHGDHREPRERSFAVDEGPTNTVDYFARLGRPGY